MRSLEEASKSRCVDVDRARGAMEYWFRLKQLSEAIEDKSSATIESDSERLIFKLINIIKYPSKLCISYRDLYTCIENACGK